MSANEPRDTYTTNKKKRDECTACPDCVYGIHCIFIHKTSTIRKRAAIVREGVMAETNGEENLPEVLSVIMCVVSVGLPVSSY